MIVHYVCPLCGGSKKKSELRVPERTYVYHCKDADCGGAMTFTMTRGGLIELIAFAPKEESAKPALTLIKGGADED